MPPRIALSPPRVAAPSGRRWPLAVLLSLGAHGLLALWVLSADPRPLAPLPIRSRAPVPVLPTVREVPRPPAVAVPAPAPTPPPPEPAVAAPPPRVAPRRPRPAQVPAPAAEAPGVLVPASPPPGDDPLGPIAEDEGQSGPPAASTESRDAGTAPGPPAPPRRAAACPGGPPWSKRLPAHLGDCLEGWSGPSPSCEQPTILRLTVAADGTWLRPLQILHSCGDRRADLAIAAAVSSCAPLPPLSAACRAVEVDVPARFAEE